MAKKVVIDNRPFCDDCKFAEWHTQQWNLDVNGQPITFGCKKGIFKFGCVRGKRKACSLYDNRGTT